MFQILPFEPHHIKWIGPASHDWDTLQVLAANEDYGKMLHRRGPGFTAFRDARPVGAAGLLFIWEGLAQVWAYLGMRGIGHQEFRAMRNGLKLLMDEHRLRRVQTEVLTEHAAAHRMIQRLGFVAEGQMEGFGVKGETYTRYALIRRL